MKHPSLLNKLGLAWQAGAGPRLSRRRFIKLTGASGLALGFAPAGTVRAAASDGGDGAELKPSQQPDEFLRIDPDGTVTIRINRLEFGQGSHTGLARVLADELDADWRKVRAELAPAAEAYKDPIFGIQMTGGSNSIQNSFTQYRELGARARAMLVEAAARQWGVDAQTVETREGRLLSADGRSAGYGEMSTAAMALPVPASVTLKTPDRFRLIGKAADRLDTPAKSDGRQSFGIDARRPGMKTVLIARPPHFGGAVAGFDDREARGVRGVDHVMQVDLDRGATGVAVVADGFWPAKMGRDKLGVEWRAPEARADTGALEAQFRQLLGRDGVTARAGDVSGLAGAARTITADFSFPFLAHSPMEPLNALIEVTGTGSGRRCDIRTGTQFQTIDCRRRLVGALHTESCQTSQGLHLVGRRGRRDRYGPDPGIRLYPLRCRRSPRHPRRRGAGRGPPGARRVRLSLRLSGGRRGRSDRQSIRPRTLGMADASDRGCEGQRQQPLRGRGEDQSEVSRCRPVLGASAAVELPDGHTDPRSGAYPSGEASARAPDRRPSCQRGQDRMAVGLCRFRRLAGVAGPARHQAPDRGSAHRRPRRSLAVPDRFARTPYTPRLCRNLPLPHREERRVRAHLLVCLLAGYLEWHLRRAWAPLLFDDETLADARRARDPVAPAKPTARARHKKASRRTDDGWPLHSLDTLLGELATRCRNTCRVPTDPSAPALSVLTEPTPTQRRAALLIESFPVPGTSES